MAIVVRANRNFWTIDDLENYGHIIIGIEEDNILCVVQ